MAKDTCESSRALKISFLKKHCYLAGYYQSGTITWTQGFSGNKNSIGIIGHVYGDDPHFRLQYTHTSYQGEKSELDYKIKVVSTPCYFGGKRYWFICPLIRNSIACNKRVGVLYSVGKYYGCRRCCDLAYESQQQTHTGKWYVLGKCLFNNELPDKLADIRIKYWHGRPTKRYQRLLRKMNNLPSEEIMNAAIEAIERRH